MQLETIDFSIIVAAYNVEKTILFTLDSLESQIFKNFEVIIVNDASSDGTDKVISAFIAQSQIAKIDYYVNKKNSGLSEVRNFGIERAVGEYILFLDGDDAYHRESLAMVNQRIVNYDTKPDLFFFSAAIFHEVDESRIDNFNLINYEIHNRYARIDGGNKLLLGIEALVESRNNETYHDSSCLIAISKKFLNKYLLRLKRGIVYEDLLFTRLIYYHASQIGIANELVLLIRKSNVSITRSPLSRLKIRSLFTISEELFNFGKKERQSFFVDEAVSIFTSNLRKIKKSRFYLVSFFDYFSFFLKISIKHRDARNLLLKVFKEDSKKFFGYNNNI